MKLVLTLVSFIFVTCIVKTKSSNILVVKVSATKSIEIFFRGFIDSLLEQGHTITYISGYETNDRPNLTRIVLDSYLKDLYGNQFETKPTNLLYSITYNGPVICNKYLKHPRTQEVIKEKYDLVMLFSSYTDCFLTVVHQQKVPFVYVSPNVMMDPKSHSIGLLEFPSVAASRITTYSYPLPFMGRLFGSVGSAMIIFLYKISMSEMDRICHEENLCEEDMPPIIELQRTVSLYICNSITALERPVKTTTPNIIYAGGLHIQSKPRNLTKDLQEWMDGAGDEGVIYFSLGTASRSTNMKKEYINIFVKVFSSLKQRVIWKWDEDYIEGLSSNVLLANWLPQQDILAHPNIRLFISHGGLFSTQEATYYAVPVIGMPLFGDQTNNAAEIVSQGWGLLLPWNKLNESSLNDAISKILTTDKMQEISKKRSDLMRDQLMTPSEKVNYWVNYVIKYDGAHHLRSPFINLPWYKIYNVDVWLFILFSGSCIVIILVDVIYKIAMFLIGYDN